MADQGLISYPGVIQPVKCRYTRQLGTMPGHAILEYNPQGTDIAANGLLSFSYAGLTVNIPGCRLDYVSVLGDTENGQVVYAKLLDRRWKWYAGGEINGHYNMRYRTSGNLRVNTEKNPQELVTLLLTAMGETGFDVSNVPTVGRPEVDWQSALPAAELDRLCDLLGVRVCLKIDTDKVVIVKPGIGLALPTLDTHTLAYSANLDERPDSIKVATYLVRFQSKLKLRAVGRDIDGVIKNIDNLSYRPLGLGGVPTWSNIDMNNFNQVGIQFGDDAKQLAIETVFSLYQIISQSDGSQFVPGFGDVVNVERIFPTDGRNLNTFTIDPVSGEERADEIFIEGQWYDAAIDVQQTVAPFTFFNNQFRLDNDTGLVNFYNEKMYNSVAGSYTEAELYLTCAYYVEDPPSHVNVRYGVTRNLPPNNGTGPFIVRRNDLKPIFTGIYLDDVLTDVEDNLLVINPQIEEQLDATEASFVNDVTYDAKYNGLKQIELDGLTQQITFMVNSRDRSGRGGCETWVSLNSETDPYVPRRVTRRQTQTVSDPPQPIRTQGISGGSPAP